MKKHFCLFCFLFSALFLSQTFASPFALSDSTGLPGDHFSLEGALELFKKAQSPEDFEKLLNSEDSEVNNLDLNEDGKTDYIRVIDNQEKDIHAIVLQVPVNAAESQDIAVIEIEKTGKENALLQIIGDENIYGKQTIVEPFDVEAEQGGKGGPNANITTFRIVVNVWAWPSVRFVYRPGYRAWVSPWRWSVYPRWYRPWTPRPYRWYSGRTVVWRSRAHVVRTHRVVNAHRVYAPRRTTSRVVSTRTTTRVSARKTPNGKVVTSRKTTTTKVARSKNGKAAATKRTTTRKATKSKNKKAVTKKKTTRVKKRRN